MFLQICWCSIFDSIVISWYLVQISIFVSLEKYRSSPMHQCVVAVLSFISPSLGYCNSLQSSQIIRTNLPKRRNGRTLPQEVTDRSILWRARFSRKLMKQWTASLLHQSFLFHAPHQILQNNKQNISGSQAWQSKAVLKHLGPIIWMKFRQGLTLSLPSRH